MKLQKFKNNQHVLTIPNDLVKAFGWEKGTELEFRITGKDELRVKKEIKK